MNTNILSKDKDPMGAAILDYQTSGKAGKLRVLSIYSEVSRRCLSWSKRHLP